MMHRAAPRCGALAYTVGGRRSPRGRTRSLWPMFASAPTPHGARAMIPRSI